MNRWPRHNSGRLLAGAMLLGAFLLLAGASDCSGFGSFCDFDSDCSDGRLCVDGSCHETCSNDGDCFGSESCDLVAREGQEDTVQVCIPPDPEDQFDAGQDTEECEMVENCCTTDFQCKDALGDSEAVCGFDGRCVIPVEKHAVVLRGETAADAEPADGIFGADIGGVFVRDAQSGEPRGYARVLDARFAEAPAVEPDAILDGQEPALDDSGLCVEGQIDDQTFSLGGTEGAVLVSFVDANGQRVRLDDSMELVAIEWGENCFEQSNGLEGFSARFCRAFGAEVDMQEDCTVALSGEEPVSGYVVIPLAGLI